MATDWARLRSMKDEDIDCSDLPEFSEEYLNKAEGLVSFPGSERVYLSIDGKVFDYFKNSGKGYWNRLNILVNSLLKDYVSKQQAQGAVI